MVPAACIAAGCGFGLNRSGSHAPGSKATQFLLQRALRITRRHGIAVDNVSPPAPHRLARAAHFSKACAGVARKTLKNASSNVAPPSRASAT